MPTQVHPILLTENCEECGGPVILVDGEYVCRNCGLVHERKLGTSKFTETEDEEGASPLQMSYAATGKRTCIVNDLGSYLDYPNSFYFHDAGGFSLSPHAQHFYSRLKYIYDKRTRFSGHETEYRTLSSLDRVVELLRIPRYVRDRAAYLYRKAIRASSGNHYSTSSVLMAYCLLLATREIDTSNPTTIQEIVNAFRKLGHRVSSPIIIKAGLHYKVLLNVALKIRRSEDYLNKVLQQVSASELVVNWLSKFKITPQRYKESLLEASLGILRKISNPERGGRSPYVFAVSTVYAAEKWLAKNECRKPFLTQKLLAEITGVAEYTIREHYCAILKSFTRAN